MHCALNPEQFGCPFENYRKNRKIESRESMATAVVMPKLGNSVESSIIIEWKKKPGDTVEEGDILVEIETDKATLEVESPAAGTLLDVFFEEGDDVPVMVNIAAIGEAGEDGSQFRPEGAAESAPAAPTPPEPVVLAAPSQPSNGKPSPAPQPQPITQAGDAGRLFISPRARNLADRKQLDISMIQGTGPEGRIIERDIEAALESQPRLTPVGKRMVETGEYVVPEKGGRIGKGDLIPAGAAAAQPIAAEDGEVVPVKGMRRTIAKRMHESLQSTAQLTLNAYADASALMAYRKKLKASDESLGLTKVSINDLIMYVVARTLPQFPDMNALFTGTEITRYRNVQLGFAVDTPRGLLVPVIRNANLISLKQLSDEAKRLAYAGLDGKLLPDEMVDGTFTVTNLGSFGVETFTPVLNPPQVGILGVGNINLRAVLVDGEVEHIPHIGLSLTMDHQAIDGAPAARFLQAVVNNLANLELMMAL